jgi:hypothetical protein
MKKKAEVNCTDSTLNKAGDEEMLFILRAKDISSPKVILHWIAKNFETASRSKLQGAFNCALRMKEYKGRKAAD